MNAHLQKILDLVSKSARVTERDRAALAKEIKEAEKAIEQQSRTLESQQRELEIEAALEQVRSRTMRMRQSAELKEVVSVLYGQLDALGLADWGCSIMIFDEKANQIENWVAESTGSDLKCFVVEGQGHPVYKKLWQHWKKQGPPLRLHHTDEKKWEFDRYWLNETGFSTLPEKVKRSVLAEREIFLTYISMHHGLISVSGYARLPDEKLAILQRFAKVFEQTYTRFLDLQKAEAQAREAQIEAALERVRASALAMHASEDLWAVTGVLRDQMALLGEKDLESTIVQIYDIELDEFEAWYSFRNPEDPHGKIIDGKAVVKCDETAKTRLDRKKYLDKETDYTIVADHKMLKEWYNYLDKVSPLVVERDNKGAIMVPKVLYYNYSKFSGGALLLITSNEAMEPSKNLLKRSAEVFNMAYTRFLDLQKAEAQAREAQIEAALERIRASAMAMQSSEELHDVLCVLFQQFDVLGIRPISAFLSLFSSEERALTYRATGTSGARTQGSQTVAIDSLEVWKALYDKWKTDTSEAVEVIYYPKEILPKLFALFEKTFSSMPANERMTPDHFPEGGYTMHGHTRFGYIGYNHTRQPTEEEKEILTKFATEFERVYQRFLDIEKAEAQAREAQIQLGLERVRARAMAMHTSAELSDASVILYRELKSLGMTQFFNFGYVEVDEPNKIQHGWTSTFEGGETEGYTLPLTGDAVLDERYNSWKNQVPVLRQVVGGSKLLKHFEYVLPQLGSQKVREMTEANFPDPTIFYNCNFKYGYLSLITGEQLDREEEALLERFTRAFELTYSRFLDLKKAEAQAREAQIEAALEKVRSASLAMHQSKDLHNVLVMLYNQLEALGLKMHSAQILESIDDFKEMHLWVVTNGVVYPEQVHAPFSKNIFFKRFREAVTNGESFYTLKSSKRQKDNLFHHFFDNTILRNAPQARKDLIFSSPGIGTSNAMGKYTSLIIMRYDGILYSEEENEIIKRFAKVLEQSYTRFLDIQKAEAQTREAQIEAALEKVRSRSLAMHTTVEMQQVANAVYDQLKELGVEMDAVGMSGAIEAKKDYDVWIGGSSFDKPLRIPFNDATQVQRDYNQAIESRSELFARTYSGEIKKEYTDHLLSHGSFPEDLKKRMLKSDAFSTSISFAKNSSIQIARYTEQPYSDKENEILKRFAKVFEQAYIRFMDIEKAEAQAREAQIEAALEKVRSRTMAMHKSQELHKVVLTVSQEIRNLGLNISAAHIYRFEEGDKGINMWIAGDGGIYPYEVYFPYIKHEFFDGIYEARTTNKNFFTLSGTDKKEKNRLYRHLIKSTKIEISEDRQKFALDATSWTYSVALGKHSGMALLRFTEEEEFSLEDNEILTRFSKVFEQAYIRFMDLKKAETQAREAQIEAAMERIRSRAIAMRSSDDLMEVALEIRSQTKFLGQQELEASAVHLYEKDAKYFESLVAISSRDNKGKITTHRMKIPINATPKIQEMMKNFWSGLSQYTVENNQKMQVAWQKVLQEHASDLFSRRLEYTADEIAADQIEYWNFADFSGGSLLTVTFAPPSNDTKELFRRAADVFDLAYKRYKDLQKAEAQARESQIEVALERVRSRAMAMHHTDELTDVLGVLFDQFDFLGINPVLTHLTLFDEENETFTLRIARGGKKQVIAEQRIDVNAVESWKTSFANWKKSELHALDCIDYPPEVLPAVWEVLDGVMSALPEGQKIFPEDFPNGLYTTQGHCKYGYIGFNHSRRATEEEKDIVVRFAKEFGRLYQRFLDIQKAEIQAREAHIEAALERVRSKTMAMHNSEDVGITVVTLFDEVLKLGLDKTIRCGIGILEGSEQMETWSATSYPNGQVDLKVGLLDMTLHPLLVGVKKSWKNGKKGFKYELRGKEVVKYYDALNKAPEYPFHVDLKTLPKIAYHNSFVFSSGILFAFTENPLSDDAVKVLNRFASVFGQTYRRYLDLQKAEEQAREAQIEAALERIRSKAMAMHSSEDLADTVEILYKELDTLQVHALRFGHGKVNSATKTVEVHTATDLGKVVGHFKLEGHPLLEKIYEHYLTKEDLYYALQGEELKSYYAILSRSIELPIPSEDAVQHGYFFFTGDTANYAWSDRALDGEELKIYGRLISVLNLTYKRYEELNNAEARAREALIEAALDRVHGQIASMRSTADLDRITPLVWNELKTLGIPFIRCGVFIIDEPAETVQVHLSAPDGHSLGVMQLPFTANTLTANSVAHWRKAQVYKAHWNQQQFIEFMQTMIDLGQIKNKKVYQGAEQPPESLHLHFLPFTQGMLYVGSSEPLEVEQIDLVQSLADAFAIAYARYDDFAQLEKAKARVETTLNELKTTQNQLVQSEKMASLGELTAGIAHEIQNPLNFVNNFSEVSKELLEEMMEEMEKGDAEEVKAIAQDLIQNLEKINHHGKRADGIVKGMLQHSRSSSGEKEPTDINTLADEYLRLAYHGLRAKDKTFNATLKTHFDASIGKVDLMAQDMGRVILNLITNAFYVVQKKKEEHPEGYEPTVTVTTRKEGNKVQIAVKDNGNGIPDAIQEKIFQPFFTTKPTGQGTGLGLSMSYDIVTKGHEGHLEVKTKKGEGSEFIISLPINE